MSYPEYYEILNIKPEASQDEIKRAYHKLAKKLHPDTHGNDKKSEEKLKKVNEAYNVLKDEKKRAEYDFFGKQAKEAELQSNEQTKNDPSVYEQPQPEPVIIKEQVNWWKYLWFCINKIILLTILLGYCWLLYSNADKNEPYNVSKMLINTADYLIKEIPNKINSGVEVLHNKYKNSSMPEKLTFYLVKNGKINLLKTLTPMLDMKALDSSDNMHSLLMSSPNGEMTEYLLSLPQDVSYVAKDGSTALSEAIERGDSDSIVLLLRSGARVEHLSKQDLHKLVNDKKVSEKLNAHTKMQNKRNKQVR